MDLKFIDQAAQSLFNSLLNSSTDTLSDKKTKDIATTAYHRAMILCEARKSFQEEILLECQCEKELPKLVVPVAVVPVAVVPAVVPAAVVPEEKNIFTEIEDRKPEPKLVKKEVKVAKVVKAVEDSEVVCSSINSDQPAVAAKRGRGRPKKVC